VPPFAIVSHTPSWVWLVLVALVWFGLKRTQAREVGLRGLLLLPLALVGYSLYNILGGTLTMSTLGGLGLGGLLGLAAGISLERRFIPTPLGGGRLLLPGEWTSLFVGVAIFLTHYGATVIGQVDPALALTDGFLVAMGGLSGFFAMLLLVRTIIRLQLARATG